MIQSDLNRRKILAIAADNQIKKILEGNKVSKGVRKKRVDQALQK